MEKTHLAEQSTVDLESFNSAQGRVYLSKVISIVGNVRLIKSFVVSVVNNGVSEEYYTSSILEARHYYNELLKNTFRDEAGMYSPKGITGETSVKNLGLKSSISKKLIESNIGTFSKLKDSVDSLPDICDFGRISMSEIKAVLALYERRDIK